MILHKEGLQTQFENIMQKKLHKSNIQDRNTVGHYRNMTAPKAVPTYSLGLLQSKINDWVKCFFNL